MGENNTSDTNDLDDYIDFNKEHKKNKKRIIIMISILIILVFFSVVFLCLKSKKISVEKQVFSLSDGSTLIFLDDETYILNYELTYDEVVMKGKYKMSFGDEINKNLISEYGIYIDQLTKDKYILGFLELQNEEIYINDAKNDNNYMNTYYILMVYNEDNKLVFNGYNVDTGIKVKFTQEKGQYNKYYEKLIGK